MSKLSTLSTIEIDTIKSAASSASERAALRLELFRKITVAAKLYVSERDDRTAFDLITVKNGFHLSAYGVNLEFFLSGNPQVISMKVDRGLDTHNFPIDTTTIPEVIAILEAALEQ